MKINFLKKSDRNFSDSKNSQNWLKKLIFTDPNIKMTSHIDVGILKCPNFFILQKKMMPPTRLLDQKFKKAEKCVFFAAFNSKKFKSGSTN